MSERTKSTVIHDGKDQVSITVGVEGIEEQASKMKGLDSQELYAMVNLSLLDSAHRTLFSDDLESAFMPAFLGCLALYELCRREEEKYNDPR